MSIPRTKRISRGKWTFSGGFLVASHHLLHSPLPTTASIPVSPLVVSSPIPLSSPHHPLHPSCFPSPPHSICDSSPSFRGAHTQSTPTNTPAVVSHNQGAQSNSEILQPPSTNSHPMVTQSKFGISKKKVFLSTKHPTPLPSNDYYDTIEPTRYSEAPKSAVWQEAMPEEFSALQSQGTWSLVPYTPDKHAVRCRWAYNVKHPRFKARLVAKSFHQEHGIDQN